jgi:hypothetical protein
MSREEIRYLRVDIRKRNLELLHLSFEFETAAIEQDNLGMKYLVVLNYFVIVYLLFYLSLLFFCTYTFLAGLYRKVWRMDCVTPLV